MVALADCSAKEPWSFLRVVARVNRTGGAAASSPAHPSSRMAALRCSLLALSAAPRSHARPRRIAVRPSARDVIVTAAMSSSTAEAEAPYPVGTPGVPWGDAERQAWRALVEAPKRSYAQEVLAKIEPLKERFDVVRYGEATRQKRAVWDTDAHPPRAGDASLLILSSNNVKPCGVARHGPSPRGCLRFNKSNASLHVPCSRHYVEAGCRTRLATPTGTPCSV